jgi:hypothetical protein
MNLLKLLSNMLAQFKLKNIDRNLINVFYFASYFDLIAKYSFTVFPK